MSRPRVMIVDGHSVLHAADTYRRELARSEPAARGLLARDLAMLHDTGDVHVVLVFDGNRARSNQERDPGGMQIAYAGGAETADHVIERMVTRYSRNYQITVASNDGLVLRNILALEAEALTVRGLLDWMEREQSHLRETLQRQHKRKNKTTSQNPFG